MALGIMNDTRIRGITIDKAVIDCELVGNMIDCEPERVDRSHLISVYNPNIKPLKGLCLRTWRGRLNVRI